MRIRFFRGGVYAVFANEHDADRYAWLFATILRRHMTCFGAYFNAWTLYEPASHQRPKAQ